MPPPGKGVSAELSGIYPVLAGISGTEADHRTGECAPTAPSGPDEGKAGCRQYAPVHQRPAEGLAHLVQLSGGGGLFGGARYLCTDAAEEWTGPVQCLSPDGARQYHDHPAVSVGHQG